MADQSNTLTEKQRLERLEKKGRTVLENFRDMNGHNLTSQYTHPVKVDRKPMPPPVRHKADRLWRYFRLLTNKPEPSYEAWIERLETDLNPEAQVFLWEGLMLCFIDVLNLELRLETEAQLWQPERSLDQWLDPKNLFAVVEKTMGLWCQVPMILDSDVVHKVWLTQGQEYRDEFYEAAHALFLEAKTPDSQRWSKELLFRRVAVSMVRVCAARKDEFAIIDKLRCERFGEHLGACCAWCSTVRKDCKMCAGCLTIFYCNRTCQRTHWRQHRMVCKGRNK